jgi:hypothetical protein
VTISERDRRALLLLGVALAIAMVYRLATRETTTEAETAPSDSIELAEKRLLRVRQLSAAVPAREAALSAATADLKRREAGLLQADTAAQAQAQLVQIVRKIARTQTPPVEIKGQEMGQIRPYGDAYGEAVVSLSLDCGIDQLINIMAGLTALPDIVATNELRFSSAQPKEKTVPARITVAALVPKRLVPSKKESTQF